MYRRGDKTVRALLNKALFTRLYVDGRKVTDHELTEPFDVLIGAYRLYEQHRQPTPPTSAPARLHGRPEAPHTTCTAPLTSQTP